MTGFARNVNRYVPNSPNKGRAMCLHRIIPRKFSSPDVESGARRNSQSIPPNPAARSKFLEKLFFSLSFFFFGRFHENKSLRPRSIVELW